MPLGKLARQSRGNSKVVNASLTSKKFVEYVNLVGTVCRVTFNVTLVHGAVDFLVTFKFAKE